MKKIGIFCFSPTGSCKKIADRITHMLNRYDVERLDLTSYKSRQQLLDFSTYHFVFFVFPVYAEDIPNVLRNYFLRLQGYDVPTALIALWGNVHSSNALHSAQQILRAQKFSVVSGAEVVAAHSYNTEKICLAIDRPNGEDIRFLENFVQQSIQLKTNSVLFPKVKVTWMARLPQSFIPRLAVKMMFDQELCTRCGLCEKKCPTAAIRENFSINNKKCIRCLACIRCCPYKARSWEFRTKMAQEHLSKFQHTHNSSRFYI